MKTIDDIFSGLSIPCTYRVYPFEDVPAVPPYAVWRVDSQMLHGADEYAKTVIVTENISLDLYTAGKDSETERDVDRALIREFFEITKDEEYDTEDNLVRITYQFKISRKERYDD